jgi:hypothetical protein
MSGFFKFVLFVSLVHVNLYYGRLYLVISCYDNLGQVIRSYVRLGYFRPV